MEKNSTIINLVVKGLEKIKITEVFEKDRYESQRKEMPGTRLVKIMVAYQMIQSRYMRGLVRAVENSESLQKAVGGEIALNTLSNALAQRPIEQMMAAWQLVINKYGEKIARIGKKFARIALIDSSLIKLSLAAYDWAQYRKAKGAVKMHMVLEWGRQIPQQLVITNGKLHDLNKAVKVDWQVGWTYVQDRGYLCFDRLKSILDGGAHFVVRVKHNTDFQIIERREVDNHKQPSGIRLTSDWTIRLQRWPEKLLRLVSYQLPDGTLVRVLTNRFDLCALNIAQLYKERWKIENWWKWIKSVFKIKEPITRNQNGLQVQIITALIADLLFRLFKEIGNFAGSLYEFVVSSQELALVPLFDLTTGSFRQSWLLIYFYLFDSNLLNFFAPDV